MKAIKVYCEDCDSVTYSVIDEYHPSYELVMCGVCGWGLVCSEKDVVELIEITK